MDRLHILLSYETNEAYNDDFKRVLALPTGSTVAPSDMQSTIKAIMRNQNPTLLRDVARNENVLNLPLKSNVGAGQPNEKTDILVLQDRLCALELISPKEHVEVLKLPDLGVPDNQITESLAGIRILKDLIAGGRLGWPPIHADESHFGGDRFGGRTFRCRITSLVGLEAKDPGTREQIEVPVFIPVRAISGNNKVHVYFDFERDVVKNTGLNGILGHGIRGATNASDWILIGVPGRKGPLGEEKGYYTIDMAAISACLEFCGQGREIHSLRLSAHSRGYRGLRETLDRDLVSISLIDRVVLLDANSQDIADVVKRKAIPSTKVIAYRVISRDFPLIGVRTIPLSDECMRAIGYSRLINDAMVTRPLLDIPLTVRRSVLPIPPRGCFTTKAPAELIEHRSDVNSPTKCAPVNITKFCDDMVKARKIAPALGLAKFIDDKDLLRIGHPLRPKIAGHHLFVAEVAHEITD